MFLEKKARKQIESTNDEMKQRIFSALYELQEGFHARLDIKKLTGTKDHYRVRVGDYRILFVLDRFNAFVYDVSHRSDAYKRSP